MCLCAQHSLLFHLTLLWFCFSLAPNYEIEKCSRTPSAPCARLLPAGLHSHKCQSAQHHDFGALIFIWSCLMTSYIRRFSALHFFSILLIFDSEHTNTHTPRHLPREQFIFFISFFLPHCSHTNSTTP